MNDRIYVGVATPQANPTVEIEFHRFLRDPVFPIVTRLVSTASRPGDRLVEYLEQLPQALQSFDSLSLRVFAFACTGSSYLVDEAREDEIIRETEQRHRVQIVTAAQAIRRELEGRGARRLAMLMPYPDDLGEAAVAYWTRIGFDIVAVHRIEIGSDTRAICDIRDEEVAEALSGFDTAGADVVMLSGTGMPTIDTMLRSRAPVLSSNLCLATEVLRRVHQWPAREAADLRALLGDG